MPGNALLLYLSAEANPSCPLPGTSCPPAAQVAALHQLGPDYQSPLLASESSGLLDQHAAAAATLALGAGMAAAPTASTAPAAPQGPPPRLLLAFCPKLAAAAAAADAGAGGGARQPGSRVIRDAAAGLPAALLAGTQLCRTRQPADMLHCLGGVAVLLPLLEQAGSGSGGGGGAEVAAGVLRLLAAMLRGSPGNQQGMQEIGGEAGPLSWCSTSSTCFPHPLAGFCSRSFTFWLPGRLPVQPAA